MTVASCEGRQMRMVDEAVAADWKLVKVNK